MTTYTLAVPKKSEHKDNQIDFTNTYIMYIQLEPFFPYSFLRGEAEKGFFGVIESPFLKVDSKIWAKDSQLIPQSSIDTYLTLNTLRPHCQFVLFATNRQFAFEYIKV